MENNIGRIEKFEKLDNEQKELVKYWMEKYQKRPTFESLKDFIEKHLTPEPVIEVEKWYKGNNNSCKKVLFFCTGFNNSSKPLGYGFDVYGDWCDLDDVTWTSEVTEATPEEVEQRLIEEAKKIYNGKKLHPINYDLMHGYGGNGVGIFVDTIHISTYYRDNAIWANAGQWNVVIYLNGQWAEIIDDKSELRETIAKLRTELSTLESQL